MKTSGSESLTSFTATAYTTNPTLFIGCKTGQVSMYGLNQAGIIVTDGNIHIDATRRTGNVGSTIYYGFYAKQDGAANTHQFYGNVTADSNIAAASFSGPINGNATGLSGSPAITVSALTVYGNSLNTSTTESWFLNVYAADSYNGDGGRTIRSNAINLKAGDLLWGGDTIRVYGARIYIGGGYSVNGAQNQGEIYMYSGTNWRLNINSGGVTVNGTITADNATVNNTLTTDKIVSSYWNGTNVRFGTYPADESPNGGRGTNSGYALLMGGLCIQWGTKQSQNSGQQWPSYIIFPVAFTVVFICVGCSGYGAASGPGNLTTTGCQFSAGGNTVTYLAIGTRIE
jgi:hypothetical protein